MKYLAVSQNDKGVLKTYVWNVETKSVHTYWDSLEKAQEVATDLNKMQKLKKASV